MAWTSLGDLTGFGSSVSGTTVTFSGIAIPANTLLVFGWDANVASLSATAADNSTQAGAANVYTTPGSLNGTTFTSGIFYCFTTRALLTTDTITITLSSAATRTSGAGAMYSVTSNNPILDTSAELRVAATTSPVTTSASALHQASEMGIAFSFVKTGAVATGTTFGASQISSPSVHVEWNSGGTVTTVATRFADGLTISAASGTTSWSYTAGFANVNIQTLFFYEGPVVSTDFPLQTVQSASQSVEKPRRYAPLKSIVSSIWANNTVVPSYSPPVSSRRVPPYSGAPSTNISAGSEPIGSSTDYAATFQSRIQPFYRGPLSVPGSAFDNATVVPGSYAAVYGERAVPLYAPPRAITIPVWDPATNTFADWTPPALLQRAVANYKPPATQPVVAWGQSVISDQIAGVFASRIAGPYRGSPSIVVPVYDPLTNTFADWAPGALLERSVPLYRSPLSWASPVFTPNPASGTDYAATFQGNRAFPFYRPPAAVTVAVWDPATNTFADWAPTSLASRAVPFFSTRPSAAVNAFDNATPSGFASVVLARAVPFYRAPLGLVVVSSLPLAPAGTGYALVVQSRGAAPTRGRSLVVQPGALILAFGGAIVQVTASPRRLGYRNFGSTTISVGAEPVATPVQPPVPVVPAPAASPPGGGGEWIIWEKPDFPANRSGAWRQFPQPSFRKPTRREKRGY